MNFVENICEKDELVVEYARKLIKHNCNEEAFFLVDINDIVFKHKLWLSRMPRVDPYYAVKANYTAILLRTMAKLKVGFDCASKNEINSVLSLGVSPEKIIYAHPCKSKTNIQYAHEVGVELMTFDNEDELHKVKSLHPNARMIIRIKVDDEDSVWSLGAKHGVEMDEVEHLLNVAKDIGVEIVGCSFHAGCINPNTNAYTQAIIDAKYVFEVAKGLDFKMTILDIGGGFNVMKFYNKIFENASNAINQALDQHFPAYDELGNKNVLQIVAEPGRFYAASSFHLVVNVIAKKMITLKDNKTIIMYYINEGVYSSFNFRHREKDIPIIPVYSVENPEFREKYLSKIWGNSLDPQDFIVNDIVLPELYIGEWLMFKNMGAYSMAVGSAGFNGFETTSKCYGLPSNLLKD